MGLFITRQASASKAAFRFHSSCTHLFVYSSKKREIPPSVLCHLYHILPFNFSNVNDQQMKAFPAFALIISRLGSDIIQMQNGELISPYAESIWEDIKTNYILTLSIWNSFTRRCKSKRIPSMCLALPLSLPPPYLQMHGRS